MEAGPLFSVLLPTHNRADVVGFAIRSILAQTVDDFELLVVGDGCTDGTGEVVMKFVERDSRVRWFDLPKGLGFGYGNRNAGLREARGEHIAYMAHDDLWMGDHLEHFVKVMAEERVEIAYSRPMWVIPRGKIAPGTFNLEHEGTLRRFLGKEKHLIPSPCVVHRRNCFEKYGYWDENLGEGGDWDMWVRVIEGGERKNLAYLDEMTTLHFRADWRNRPALFGDVGRVWDLFYEVEGFMPRSLKVDVPEGMTEQEALWRVMSADQREWAKEIRRAVRVAMDERIEQNNDLILRLMKEHPSLGIAGMAEALGRVKIAWRPGFVLQKLIGWNNRIKRKGKGGWQ